MSHEISLYGSSGSRSARCLWALNELQLEYEHIDESGLIGSDKLRQFHPQSKIPAAIVDGVVLFESSAICNYLCDVNSESGLIPLSSTPQRAIHDQWVSFAQSEIEAYLWSNIKHRMLYPEERRVPNVIEQNNIEIHSGLKVLDAALTDSDYLLGSDFQVTDIIVGWTVNWARRSGVMGDYPKLVSYNRRLLERKHCVLNPE
jgi:glutathione S-transferase